MKATLILCNLVLLSITSLQASYYDTVPAPVAPTVDLVLLQNKNVTNPFTLSNNVANLIALNSNAVNEVTQKQKAKYTYHPKQAIAATMHGTVITSTLLILNKYWYADYARQPLASFDDSKEWLQIDKLGHIYSTYLEARLSSEIWRWAGVGNRKSALLGAAAGMVYQLGFEVLDGLSAEYGFSWTDVAANTLGASLYVGQELLWQQQRIQPKISYSNQHYDPALLPRIRNLYGTGGAERFLKDYNGQTHWYSCNLYSFAPHTTLPRWLNVAVGIGATGLFGGFSNTWKDANNNTITRHDIARQRQFYLAPDIDFTKIKTKRKGIKIVLHFLNLIKLPTPGLLLTGGKLQLKALAY